MLKPLRLCAGWFYVKLTQAKIIKEEGGSLTWEIPLKQQAVGKPARHFLN